MPTSRGSRISSCFSTVLALCQPRKHARAQRLTHIAQGVYFNTEVTDEQLDALLAEGRMISEEVGARLEKTAVVPTRKLLLRFD